MKKCLFAISTLTSFYLNAQNGSVGINTVSPKATLHVMGSPTDTSKLDGIIAPIITGDKLAAKTYGTDQTGAILYVTAPCSNLSGQVINVSKIGYYYFNGSEWIPLNSEEKDTLESVMLRGNYAPKKIDFETTSNPFSLYYKNNNFFASNSFNNLSTGTHNILLGQKTGENLSTATKNILIGNSSGNYLTSGSQNVFIGYNSGLSYKTGKNNTIIGYLAGQGDPEGNSSDNGTFIGAFAGFKSKVGNNTALGYQSLNNTNTGGSNTAIGNSSLSNNTTGRFNAALGNNSGMDLEGDGSFNTFIGSNVYSKDTGTTKINGNKNVFIGFSAGGGINGDNNVFIGAGAGYVDGSKTAANINNRLVIHNQITFTDAGTNTIPTILYNGSLNNGLIVGDFSERWVKFNGSLIVNPSYLTADATFTKNVVAKPDGTFGIENKISVPAPPTTGNYILKSINGVIQWIAE